MIAGLMDGESDRFLLPGVDERTGRQSKARG